jgi:hypothetical protein
MKAHIAKNWDTVGVGFALRFFALFEFWIYIAESGHVSVFM